MESIHLSSNTASILTQCKNIHKQASLIRDLSLPEDEDQANELFCSSYESLNYLEKQLQFIEDTLSANSNNSDLNTIKSKYSTLDCGIFRNLSTLEQVNAPYLSISLEQLSDYVERLYENLKTTLKKGYIDDDLESQLLVNTRKIKVACSHLDIVALMPKDDLFMEDRSSSKRWEALQPLVEIVELAPSKEMRKQKEIFFDTLYSNIFMKKSQNPNAPGLYNDVRRCVGMAYYIFVNNKPSRRVVMPLYCTSTTDTLFSWRVVDETVVKHLIDNILIRPPIKFCECICVDRQWPQLTREFIEENIEALNDPIKPFFSAPFERKPLPKKGMTFKDFMKKGPNKVSIRVISQFNLFSKPDKEVDEIIIHIHGGGWAATSADLYDCNTRVWVKDTNVPVFSFDYRLAPENPYPSGLDDCWQAYNWILDYAEEVMGIKPKKIIFCGESAGGNLVLALNHLALKAGRKTADGFYLAYPALNAQDNMVSPSLIRSLDDPMIPVTMLKTALECYVGEYRPSQPDPLLSTVVTHKEILRKFPPVRMVVGDEDPLHDDCWRFMERLKDAGVDAKMRVYKETPHGLMNVAFNLIGSGVAKKMVKDGSYVMNGLWKVIREKEGLCDGI